MGTLGHDDPLIGSSPIPSLALPLLDAAPDGMLLTNADGTIVLVNKQLESLFGYDRHELIGTTVERLLPDRFKDGHAAHRRDYRIDPRPRSMGSGLDLWARRADGSEFPVEISLSPVTEHGDVYYFASIRDVSDRLETERQLRESEAAFRASFEDAPVAMMIVGLEPSGRRTIQQANRAMGAMLGLSAETLQGMSVDDVTHPDDNDTAKTTASEMLDGTRREHQSERRFRRADGTFGWMDVHARAIVRGGEIQVLTHALDVTDRHASEAARERTVAWTAALADARRAMLDGEVLATTLTNLSEQAGLLAGADHAWVTYGPREVTAVAAPSRDDGRRLEFPLGPGFGGETSGLVLTREDTSAVFAPHTIAAATNFVEQVVLAVEASQSRQNKARLNVLEDRDRIARDLHDLVIQRLFATGLGLQSLAARFEAGPISDRLEATVTELDNIIRELRSTIFGLGQVDRVASIRQQITEAALSHTEALGFSPRITFHGQVDELPLAVVEQLLPTLHEALSNVVRHAAASSVSVTVDLRADHAVLEILDDGVGIADGGIRGNGLTNLTGRARRIGGDCVVERRSMGRGTAVIWTAPR